MKSFFIFLTSIILFSSCADVQNENMQIEYTTAACKGKFLEMDSVKFVDFRIHYLGSSLESIKVDPNQNLSQKEIQNQFNKSLGITDVNLHFLLGRHPINPEAGYLNIFIDTTQMIVRETNMHNINTSLKREMYCANSYPLLIKSTYQSFCQIGYGDQLSISYEIKNSRGEWISIMRPLQSFCGTGMEFTSILSGDMLISSIPITKGDIKTKARITLGNCHSNEFDSFINSTIYESI